MSFSACTVENLLKALIVTQAQERPAELLRKLGTHHLRLGRKRELEMSMSATYSLGQGISGLHHTRVPTSRRTRNMAVRRAAVQCCQTPQESPASPSQLSAQAQRRDLLLSSAAAPLLAALPIWASQGPQATATSADMCVGRAVSLCARLVP